MVCRSTPAGHTPRPASACSPFPHTASAPYLQIGCAHVGRLVFVGSNPQTTRNYRLRMTELDKVIEMKRSRRDFLRGAALAVAIPSTLAACSTEEKPTPAPAASAPAHPAPAAAAAPQKTDADAMDKMHEAGVKAFPAKTEG